MNFSTFAASYQMSSFMGFSIKTRSFTSCSMSLSLETMTTSSGFSGAGSDGADDVVGLEAGEFEDGNAHALRGCGGHTESVRQIGRHFGAVRLVFRKASERKVGSLAFEDGGDVLRLVAGQELRTIL